MRTRRSVFLWRYCSAFFWRCFPSVYSVTFISVEVESLTSASAVVLVTEPEDTPVDDSSLCRSADGGGGHASLPVQQQRSQVAALLTSSRSRSPSPSPRSLSENNTDGAEGTRTSFCLCRRKGTILTVLLSMEFDVVVLCEEWCYRVVGLARTVEAIGCVKWYGMFLLHLVWHLGL